MEKPVEKNNQKIVRTLNGVVISNKMDKTAVVKVDRIKEHPVYKKRFRVSKKYKIHDPKNEAQIGDKVSFREVRPLSKDKRWLLVSREANKDLVGDVMEDDNELVKEINQDKPEV